MTIRTTSLAPMALALFAIIGSTTVVAASSQPLTVAQVAVLENGVRSPDVSGEEAEQVCAPFRLSQADVRRYFRRAARVSERGYYHDLPMSPCQASGTVRFANGWDGRWTIDSYRRGRFVRADGLSILFFCTACANPKFERLDAEERAIARAVTLR
jgi:hypothetical protein